MSLQDMLHVVPAAGGQMGPVTSEKEGLMVQSVEDVFSRRLWEVVFNFVVFVLMQG